MIVDCEVHSLPSLGEYLQTGFLTKLDVDRIPTVYSSHSLPLLEAVKEDEMETEDNESVQCSELVKSRQPLQSPLSLQQTQPSEPDQPFQSTQSLVTDASDGKSSLSTVNDNTSSLSTVNDNTPSLSTVNDNTPSLSTVNDNTSAISTISDNTSSLFDIDTVPSWQSTFQNPPLHRVLMSGLMNTINNMTQLSESDERTVGERDPELSSIIDEVTEQSYTSLLQRIGSRTVLSDLPQSIFEDSDVSVFNDEAPVRERWE